MTIVVCKEYLSAVLVTIVAILTLEALDNSSSRPPYISDPALPGKYGIREMTHNDVELTSYSYARSRAGNMHVTRSISTFHNSYCRLEGCWY